MSIPEPEPKQVEVTFKFYLPDNQYDLSLFQEARKYRSALEDIYRECRTKWKYDDKASEETIEFAQEIGKIAWVDDI